MPAGRPPRHNNCMDIDCLCEIYWDECDEVGIPGTIEGLSLALGFIDRHQFTRHEDKNDRLSTIYKKHRSKLADRMFKYALKNPGATGLVCFVAKNAFKYVDKQIIDQSVTDKTDRSLDNNEEIVLREAADKLRRARLKVVGAPSE